MADDVNVLELVRDVIAPFSHPRETKREMVFAPPEDDRIYVMAEMRDFWKLGVLAGAIDRDYLESLPPKARPSNEFLVEIERLAEKVEAVAEG